MSNSFKVAFAFVLLGTLGPATSGQAQEMLDAEIVPAPWRQLESFAREAYEQKLAFAHSVILERTGRPPEGAAASSLDDLTKQVVYLQTYAVLRCSDDAASAGEAAECVATFMADFQRGSELANSLHAILPVESTICMSEAWNQADQAKYPPFTVLRFEGIRLYEMGTYISCMRDMQRNGG